MGAWMSPSFSEMGGVDASISKRSRRSELDPCRRSVLCGFPANQP